MQKMETVLHFRQISRTFLKASEINKERQIQQKLKLKFCFCHFSRVPSVYRQKFWYTSYLNYQLEALYECMVQRIQVDLYVLGCFTTTSTTREKSNNSRVSVEK